MMDYRQKTGGKTTMERGEAKELGLKTYDTGRPCSKHSHLSPRYTSTGNCVACCEITRQLETAERRAAKGLDLVTGLERASGLVTGVWAARPDLAQGVITAIQLMGGTANGIRGPLAVVDQPWEVEDLPAEWVRQEMDVPVEKDLMQQVLHAAKEMCHLRGEGLQTWVVGPGSAPDLMSVGFILHRDDAPRVQELVAGL